MSDWLESLRVGDKVALRYIDHVEPGKTIPDLPLVEGEILALPSDDQPCFELYVSDEEIRSAGGWVSEEAEGLPYLAQPGELVGTLPETWERENIEEWLTTNDR